MVDAKFMIPGTIANAKVYVLNQRVSATGSSVTSALAKVYNDDIAINQFLAEKGYKPSSGFEQVVLNGAESGYRYGGRSQDGWDAHLQSARMPSFGSAPGVSLIVKTVDGKTVELELKKVEKIHLGSTTSYNGQAGFEGLRPEQDWLTNPWH